MKLCGEFVIRDIAEEIVAIPVGETALKFNGMIMLNKVSSVIWQCLEKGTDIESIVTAITDMFDVSESQAQNDIIEFLEGLRKINLIEE